MMAGADDSNSATVADTHRFSLATHDWEVLAGSQTYDPVILAGVAVYAEALYFFFGWDTENQQDNPKIYKAEIDVWTWEEVTIDGNVDELMRDSFGYALVGSKFYMLAGYTGLNGLVNSLAVVELANDNVTYSLFPSRDTPSVRVGHTLDNLAGELYLFGGESNEEKLNDFWKYDPVSLEWLLIVGSGMIPPPRAYHASSAFGDSLIIWGGVGNSGYLDDMYRYSLSTNTWEQLESTSEDIPSPRRSACIALHTPLLFLYGGKTEIGLSTDLWQYDTGTLEYTLLSVGSSQGPGAINKHKCVLEVEDDTLKFYVMFGTGGADKALGEIHCYDSETAKWTKLFTSNYPRNGALVEKIGNNIAVAGGETWGIYIQKHFVWIDLESQSEEAFTELDIPFMNGATAYLLNNLYFLGGSNSLGSIIRSTVPRNKFYRIDLKEECDSCSAACSLGSEPEGNHCTLCPKGYYSEFVNSSCEPCPTGFYNPHKGATSSKQCIPCPEGSFNPNLGASYCLDCPAQATCSIGSSTFTYALEEDNSRSIQPELYVTPDDRAAEVALYIMLVIAIVGVVVLILFLVWKRLHVVLRKMDLYDSKHTHGEGKAVILTKTKIGGTFSIVFFILALIMVASTLPTYFIANLFETKTLIPFIILESDYTFECEMLVTITLSDYYAPCAVEDSACDSTIGFYTENFQRSDGRTMLCSGSEGECVVAFHCSTCEISSSSLLSFDFKDELSYASAIAVNVTSFSSIPDKYSSATQIIHAEADNVFRGYPASVFYFSMSTSLYQNSVNDDEFTGYHTLINRSPDIGAMYTPLDVPFTSDLLVEVELARSENSLLTIRAQRSSLLLLLITLLGSISGAMGAVGAGMSATESFFEKTSDKVNTAQAKKRLKERRQELKVALQSDDPSNPLNRSDVSELTNRRNTKELMFTRKENAFDAID